MEKRELESIVEQLKVNIDNFMIDIAKLKGDIAKEVEPSIINYLGKVVEDDDNCLEAHVHCEDGKILTDTASITVTDKRDGEKEFWDNEGFFDQVLAGDYTELAFPSENFKKMLLELLKDMKKDKWF